MAPDEESQGNRRSSLDEAWDRAFRKEPGAETLRESGQEEDGLGGLEERAKFHQAIIAQSPHPIFLVDPVSGQILDNNPALGKLLRFGRDQLKKRTLFDLDAGPRDEVVALLRRAAREHHDIFGDRCFLTSDGEEVWVEVSANLVLRGRNEVLCLFARDITPYKETSEERELLQKQLWYAQKHEAVGRLASGIAHDFNNILQAIVLNAEWMQARVQGAGDLEERLDDIRTAGFRAQDLVRQMLAFSGQQALEPKCLDLSAVIQDTERLLQRTVPENVQLGTRFGKNLGAVMADPNQLQQILLNLVMNAVDAMPDGGRVDLRTMRAELDEEFTRRVSTLEPGPYVLLTVTDNGIGMDEATQSRIFDPFFTTKQKGRGTGLGLATVYGIVKQMGGGIWVESSPGKGTQFRVYFPEVEGEPTATIWDDEEVSEEAPVGSERIFLVEDEDSVRGLTAQVLTELGYTVEAFESPWDALKAMMPSGRMVRKDVKLLVADVVLPGLSGPELAREMVRRHQELDVLFVSAYPNPDLGDDDPELAGSGFLAKPFTRAQLARAVRAALDE